MAGSGRVPLPGEPVILEAGGSGPRNFTPPFATESLRTAL